MWQGWVGALGVLCMIEGMMYWLAPHMTQRLWRYFAACPSERLRVIGVGSLVIGGLICMAAAQQLGV